MKSYRAYNVLTNEELGRYASPHEAYEVHKSEPITVIYRPSKRRKK